MKYLLALIIALSSVTASAVTTVNSFGITVRLDDSRPDVYLVFTADTLFDGGERILDILDSTATEGSFFLTGNFLRHHKCRKFVKRMIERGDYIGPHSDRHILTADWDAARTPLVTPDSLIDDIRRNMAELASAGVDTAEVKWLIPPYEWCDATQAKLYSQEGFTVITPTPGIRTYTDYIGDGEPGFIDNDSLIAGISDFEARHGFGGVIMIIHPGTFETRREKLYNRLPEIIAMLRARGYTLRRLP